MNKIVTAYHDLNVRHRVAIGLALAAGVVGYRFSLVYVAYQLLVG